MNANQHQLINQIMTTEVIDSGLLTQSAELIVGSLLSGLNIHRAGLWLYNSERREDLAATLVIDQHHNIRDTSTVLKRLNFPNYFDALDKEVVIVANDTFSDPITSEFTVGYLDVLNISSMLDAPIRINGKTVGVVCCENIGPIKTWTNDEILFATLLADQFGRALAAHEKILQYQELENTSKALSRQTAHLKALHHSLDHFSLIANFDDHGTITEINGNYLALSKFDKPQLIGASFSIFEPKLIDCPSLTPMWETLHQDKIWQGIMKQKDKEKQTFWLNATVSPVKNHYGKTEGYIGFFHDITHEIEMENQLYQAEKMAQMGSFSYDFHHQEWRVSQNFHNIFQHDAHLSFNWDSLNQTLSHANLHTLHQHFDQLTGQQPGSKSQCILQQQDHWFQFIFQRHKQSIIGSCQDITQQTLQQLTLDNIILLQNTMFDSANATIIATNQEGVITHFNKTAESLLQYKADDIINQKTPCQFHLTHEIRQNAHSPLPNDFFNLVEKADMEGAEEKEYHYLTKNGQTIPMSLSITAIKNDAHQLLGYLFIGRDLRAQKAVERDSERLRSIMETAGDIAAFSGFSYEVKNGALHLTHDGFKQLITQRSGQQTITVDDALPCLQVSERSKVLNALEKAVHQHTNFDVKVSVRQPNPHQVQWLRIVGRTRAEDQKVSSIIGFIQDISKQSQLESKLSKQAYTDELTQLANRRWLIDYLNDTWKHHFVKQTHPSIILMDIDHFKKVNDRWGHDAGDQALKHLANTITPYLPEHCLFGRFGGEEFMIVLNHCGESDATELAERIRQAIEQKNVIYNAPLQHDPIAIPLTLSLGISSLENKTIQTLKEWLNTADEALYKAKASGRNQVIVYQKQHSSLNKRYGN